MSICGNPTDYVVLALLALPPPAPVWDFWAFRPYKKGTIGPDANKFALIL